MASQTAVLVQNIAPSTSDKEVRDFFSFCGKVTDISVTLDGETKSATVSFEKETAAKTALLLNNTQLGSSHISVTGAADAEKEDHSTTANAERDSDEITQEEKPRTRILAEYLAHGYVVGDATLQRAIELDHRHGVSNRFLNTLQTFDQKYRATDRARTADQSYHISERANSLLTGLGSYFEKASNTPTGQRIVKFYTDSSRQVQDIHNEARRLAEIKKQEHGGSAYKAAGFEKVFGPAKPFPSGSGAPGAAQPAAPAQGGAETESPAGVPKFDPPPTV